MTLAPETRLGPYEIQSPLGAGGMGEVYRARDTRLDRTVAIKILPEAFSSDTARLQRFEQEARLLGTLNHPNVVAVFDVGGFEGTRYLVSELLEGQNLRERMSAAPVPLRKAVEYAIQVAYGLAAAHAKGIVHRDLKPENVFITNDGRVKILDFGLAKATQHAAGAGADATQATMLSEPGVVLGTAGYMSPEQVRGHAADQRSDIFSFGAVLYELVSGQRAFRGDSSVEVMNSILKDDPPELSTGERNIPPALERIIRRCMEKSPEERFQSARDLGFALEAIAAPSSASGSGAAIAAGRPRSRLGLIVATSLVAVTLVGLLAFMAASRRVTSQSPSYQQLTFDPGYAGPARFTRDGNTVVYSAAWNGGPVQLYSQRTTATQPQSLNLDADVLGIADNGEMAVILKHRYRATWLASGTLARLPLEGGTPRPILEDVYAADINRDGKDIAVVRSAGGKQRLEFPIGKVLFETQGWITDVRISPDGARIAFLEHPVIPDDGGNVAVVDLQGNYRRLTPAYASCHGLAWTPDGKEIWHAASLEGEEEGIYAVTLAGHSRTVLRSPIELQLQDISPSGKVLLESVRYQIEMGVKRIEDKVARAFDAGVDMAAISPGGEWLVFNRFQGTDYQVFLRNTNGAAPTLLGEGFGSGITPDGRMVAAMRVAEPHKLILYPTGPGEQRDIDLGTLKPAFSGNENGVTFSSDRRFALLAAFDTKQEIRDYLVDLRNGSVRPVTPAGSKAGKLSPDGTRVVTLNLATHEPLLADVASGKTSDIPGIESHDEVIGWSSDGRSLSVWNQELPARLFFVDVASGRRQFVQSVEPIATLGSMYARLVASGDGKVAAYRLRRGLYAIYIADGLR